MNAKLVEKWGMHAMLSLSAMLVVFSGLLLTACAIFSYLNITLLIISCMITMIGSALLFSNAVSGALQHCQSDVGIATALYGGLQIFGAFAIVNIMTSMSILSNVEKLSTMKPAFKQDGTATAGNSSQVSNGAAAALMMRRSTAEQLGLKDSIIGKWAGTQVVGCKPDEMGIGPALAIPRLLDYTGVKKDEIGIWEINEAFASQAIFCVRELGIDSNKVNPKGGAIALGHPLGATGARQ